MKLENATIGVWGLGLVGASVIRFLQRLNNVTIIAMDKCALTDAQKKILAQADIRFFNQNQIEDFFNTADYVIPSPGINLRYYQPYIHQCISEVDLFYTYWKKPSLVITGTVGKTTITHTLSHMLRTCGYKIATGGNIGTHGMDCLLDMLLQQEAVDYAVLELSSFQLEQSRLCTPHVAIITNLYPNHLDYHETFDAYLHAKWQCILNQHKQQTSIIPFTLLSHAQQFNKERSYRVCSSTPLNHHETDSLGDNILYYLNDNKDIIRHQAGTEKILISHLLLPTLSYHANWLTIAATLDALDISLDTALSNLDTLNLPEHRLNASKIINGIHFYNDSKATIPQATLAAIDKIQSSSIILLWGGVSKGVDRTSHLPYLASRIKHIICFGKEADDLLQACKLYNINATSVPTLQDAFTHAVHYAATGDHILFSPAGASFDLFQNYQERGESFLALVDAYEKSQNNRNT